MGDWMASVSSASVDALKQIDLALKNSISNKNGTTQLSPDKPAAKKQKNTESNTYAHKVASGPPASRYIPGLARPGIGQPSVSLKQTHSNYSSRANSPMSRYSDNRDDEQWVDQGKKKP